MASKRTPEVRAAVLAVLKLGHFRETAARKAGIDPATLCRWIQDDEALRREVEGIEADDEIRLVQIVRKAAREDPKWALAILERRHKRWSAKGGGDESAPPKDDGAAVPFGFEEQAP